MDNVRIVAAVPLAVLVLSQLNFICSVSCIDVEDNSVLDSLLVEMQALKSEIKVLQSDVKALKVENTQQDLEIENLKNQLGHSNNYVSFTAVTSTDRAYVTGESIVFDNVLRNYGDAYDASGVFTCPVTGYYLFFVNVYTSPDQDISAEIYIQNQEGTTPELIATEDGWDNGSTLVVSQCTGGSQVSVRVTERGGPTAASNVFRSNSFTGVLLSLSA